jgi:acetoin:2,6-dichlorophenolindophenol oxidoreductase subunit beta
MFSNSRKISYSLALNEAFHQLMAEDPSVFLIGQGVKSPWYVGNTTRSLLERFGSKRVIDTPVSENAINGAAVGAALAGMRPVVVHPRIDFMVYGLDPIINEAANWHYMFGGRSSVPVVVWAIINRGGEQAAQHSQALQSLFTHIPGLKVVMPSNPYDAKGLMVSAVRDENPVIYLDERWLYGLEAEVPESIYEVPLGQGAIRRAGSQVTVVATSFMVQEALQAAATMEERGIYAEVIDLRTLKPLDSELIFSSVRKTGRVVIADGGWKTCGIAGEIVALIAENLLPFLKSPPERVTLPDLPAPASRSLEKAYFPTAENIIQAMEKTLEGGS